MVWLSKAGTKEDLLQTTISPSGSQGATAKVVAGWGSLANGSLVSTSSGLQAFFAGIRSTSTSDPYSSGTVFTATGASWMLGSGPVAAPSSAYASDLVASTLEKNGTPVTAWTGTSGFYIHEGVDPAKPNVKVQAACCAYNASLATDGTTGAVYAAWYSNAANAYGLHWRRVLPSLGADRVLPGSASADRKSAVSPIQAVGTNGGIAFWHTQVEPGLTLVVHGKTFAVLDAGDPVHGAKVQLAGPQAATLSAPAGTATAGTLVPGRYTATATALGYTSATASLVVPRA